MPRPIDVPEHLEEQPDRTAIAPAAYDWPEQLEADLRAMVAERNQFCSLCDVSLDLHDGPGSCRTAGAKADLIAHFYGGAA